MSQFILFKHKKEEAFLGCLFTSISTIKENIVFFEKCSTLLLKNIDIRNIYTVVNFDEICIQAQEALSKNIDFENTQLWSILNELKEEEVYFWYSNELDNLDNITCFDILTEEIEKSLINMSGEFYIHYKPMY